MDIRELLKTLVETDDKMARMELVEQNAALMDAPATADDGGAVAAIQAELDALKQKYIDTFFNGGKETETPKADPKNDETDESGKTLDDLFPNA